MLIIFLVLNPDMKMSHFVDHWPVDLQQKVREDAEKIASVLSCISFDIILICLPNSLKHVTLRFMGTRVLRNRWRGETQNLQSFSPITPEMMTTIRLTMTALQMRIQISHGSLSSISILTVLILFQVKCPSLNGGE